MRAPLVYETVWGSTVPATQQTTPTSFGNTLNHWITFAVAGWVIGAKVYQAQNSQTVSHIAFLIDTLNGGNSIVAAAPFKRPPAWTNPPAAKWQSTYFQKRYAVTAGQTLRLGVAYPTPFSWWYTAGALTSAAYTNGNLTLPQDVSGQHNGLWQQGISGLILTNAAGSGRMFGIDVLFIAK